MSASLFDSTPPARDRPRDWAPPTTDLDSTTDLHEEHTTDLLPVTEDVEDVKPAPHAEPAPDAPMAMNRDAPRRQQCMLAPQSEPRAAQPPETAIKQPTALAPGAVLNDRYLLEQVLGRGGTAVVYRARDMLSSASTQRNAQCAIKAPRPELADRERAAARLRHEFDLCHRLSHPNIVRTFELHDDGRHCFMLMELIEGRPLSALLSDWTMLSPPLAHKILRDCAHALSHAHGHGVVHGDFKPGNVFVTAQEQVKVLDFGAAARMSADDSSRIHAGTPAYASPEVLSGATPEQRDDVFSFACVAYELLTGQHPFERRSSLQARDEGRVPPRAWSLSATQWLTLRAALGWERSQRPADIQTLLQALSADGPRISETAPIHAAPETVSAAELATDLMPSQRSWGFFIFIACALAITLIATQRKLAETSNEQTRIAAPSSQPTPSRAPAASPISPSAAQPAPASPARAEKEPQEAAGAATASATATAPAVAPARATPAAALSEISFDSRPVIASEGSIAAVFLIKRSQPLSGRVRVSWSALSGSADAGIDFASNAAGSVEFADGQAQRAIYVPLRNDLLEEGDETFTVRLHTPRRVRLSNAASTEATILDDD